MNAPFTPPIPTLRASSVADLLDCPARWEAKHLRGLTSKTSAAAHLGTAIHEATTLHDYAVLNDAPVALADCEGVFIDALYSNADEVDWADSSTSELERTGRALVGRYIAEIAPTQTYIGVEVRAEPVTLSDLGLTLTGTIDRIYQDDDGSLGIGDIKTGKTAVSADGSVKTSGHGVQMGVYTLLAQVALGEPVRAPARIYGLTTAKTAAGQRVGVGAIDDPLSLVLGSDEQPGLLHYASQILKSGLFYGNSKSTLCHPKYCPAFSSCPFKA